MDSQHAKELLKDFGFFAKVQRMEWDLETPDVKRNPIERMIFLVLDCDAYLFDQEEGFGAGLTQIEFLYLFDSYPPIRRKTTNNAESKKAKEFSRLDLIKKVMGPLEFVPPISPQHLNGVLQRMAGRGELTRIQNVAKCERPRYQERPSGRYRLRAIRNVKKKVKAAKDQQFLNNGNIVLLFPESQVGNKPPERRVQRNADKSQRTKSCVKLTYEASPLFEKAIESLLDGHKEEIEKAAHSIYQKSQHRPKMNIFEEIDKLKRPMPMPMILIDVDKYYTDKILEVALNEEDHDSPIYPIL